MGQRDTFGKALIPRESIGGDADRSVLPDELALRMGRKIYKARRLRDEMFSEFALFGEPAWDILLDAWDAELSGRTVSVSSACVASGAPASTALRKVAALERERLVERTEDPADRRRSFLRLTALGRERMQAYFESLARIR